MSGIGNCQPYTQLLITSSQLAIADWQARLDEQVVGHSEAILVSTLFSKAIIGLILPFTLVEMVGRVSLIPVALMLNAPDDYYEKAVVSLYQPLHNLVTLCCRPEKLNRVAIEIDALYQESLIFGTSSWSYIPLAPEQLLNYLATRFDMDFSSRVGVWKEGGNRISTWIDFCATRDLITSRHILTSKIAYLAVSIFLFCCPLLVARYSHVAFYVLSTSVIFCLPSTLFALPSRLKRERLDTAIAVLDLERPPIPDLSEDRINEYSISDVFKHLISDTHMQIKAINHPYMDKRRDDDTVKEAIYLFENHQFSSLLLLWNMKELGMATLSIIDQLNEKKTIEDEKSAPHLAMLDKLTKPQMDYLVQCIAEANYPVTPNFPGSEKIGPLDKNFENLYLFITRLGGNLLHNKLYLKYLAEVNPKI